MAIYDRSVYAMYLRNVPMFSRLPPEQLDRVAELGTAVSVRDGDVVVQEGETGDDFYVLMSGKAQVVRGGRDIAALGAGDFFGELALFDPAPRNATVTATSDCSLVTLSREGFRTALDEMPPLRDAVLHGMARRLHELDARA